MARIAMLVAVTLVLAGLAAAPAAAQPIGPFAVSVETAGGGHKTCAEVFVSSNGAPDQFMIEGRTRYVDGQLATLMVLGTLAVVGANALWGFEAFPTPLAPLALKLGGLFALSTLTGNASGYFFTPTGIFLFASLLFALQAGSCPSLQ